VLDDESVRIGPQLIARMMRDICKGMSVIHKAKIIHRDLKPQNLMVDKHYRIKVGDFGVSRMLPGSNSAHSGFALSIAGSSVYIAPEVYNLRYTHKCDVFSMGMIIWEMCTRQYINVRPEELMQGIRPDIPADCPALYAYLIRACWDADPTRRPEFRAILALLKQWKGREADFNFTAAAAVVSDGASASVAFMGRSSTDRLPPAPPSSFVAPSSPLQRALYSSSHLVQPTAVEADHQDRFLHPSVPAPADDVVLRPQHALDTPSASAAASQSPAPVRPGWDEYELTGIHSGHPAAAAPSPMLPPPRADTDE
jgi:serine/threonine protein kinase